MEEGHDSVVHGSVKGVKAKILEDSFHFEAFMLMMPLAGAEDPSGLSVVEGDQFFPLFFCEGPTFDSVEELGEGTLGIEAGAELFGQFRVPEDASHPASQEFSRLDPALDFSTIIQIIGDECTKVLE